MKFNMEIARKVLLTIEEQFDDVAIYNLKVEDIPMKTIAYHCNILQDGGFIKNYKSQFADDELYCFSVGSLTWDGHELLDKIRDERIWAKTKDKIQKEGLPMIIDVVKSVATGIISSMLTAAI